MKRRRILPLLGRGLVGLATLGVALLLIGMTQLLIERIQAQPLPVQHIKPGNNVSAAEEADPQSLHPTPENKMGDDSSEKSSSKDISYEEMFREVAIQYDLDWRLLAELAYQESRMNPWAIGKDNDMGLMQIIPTTWNEFAPQVGVTDPFDPYSNIQVGAAYLAYVRDFSHSRGYTEDEWMLVGYNWGPDNLNKLFAGNSNWAQVPARQQNYALDILKATYSQTDRWRSR